MKRNTNKMTALLEKAYDILAGIASEQGEEGLRRYGDPAVLDEIADALGIGGDGSYYAVEYTAFTGRDWQKMGVKPQKKWGVCMDPKNPDKTWCLTGFTSKEEVIREFKAIVPDAVFKEVA